MIKILALDPALNHTGWVVLKYSEKGKNREGIGAGKYGIIKPNTKDAIPVRLFYNRQELINVIRAHRPDVVVVEDTFSGPNRDTTSKLNQWKGVVSITVYELLKKEPIFIRATSARSCLGFKDAKDEAFAYFTELYNLPESFEKGNDITDAFTVGFWYILNERGACEEKKKKVNGRRRKTSQRSKEKKSRAKGADSSSKDA